MATVKINLSDQQAKVLREKAASQGLTLEDWFKHLAEQEIQVDSVEGSQQNLDEWMRQFDEFLSSIDPNTPVLSDEDMSRESIYPDRIWLAN